MQCKEKVYIGVFERPTRKCSRRAVMGDYCQQHHPDTIKAKEEASSKKWDEDCEQRKIEHYGPHFKKALELIANGDLDNIYQAQAIAQKALEVL